LNVYTQVLEGSVRTRNVSLVSRYPSGRSFVIIEQPAEPRPTANPLPRRPVRAVIDECVVQSLMIPLTVIVLDVRRDRLSQMAVAERDHAVEALLNEVRHLLLAEHPLEVLIGVDVTGQHRVRDTRPVAWMAVDRDLDLRIPAVRGIERIRGMMYSENQA
jgi:hypothetical protein